LKVFGRKKSEPNTVDNAGSIATERRYVPERVRERMTGRQSKVLTEAKEKIRLETEKIRAISDNPESLDYFLDIGDYFGKRAQEVIGFKNKGGKVVGTFCEFVPNEIIHAAGAIPIQLSCGFSEAIQPANDLLSDAGLCPLMRSSLGTMMTESSTYYEASDMIVNPTPCDAKLKMGEIIQDLVPVVTMNVPRVKDSFSARKQWIQEVWNLKERVEQLVQKKIKKQTLRESIETYQAAQNVWRKFWDIRKKGNVIWGRQSLLVSWLTYIDDIQRWTLNMNKLNSELEKRITEKRFVCGDDTPRVMLAGSPIIWPNWKILNLVEESGAYIACDELCSGMRVLWDHTVVDEWTEKGMMDAVADKYFLPCTCPCFSPNLEREENMLRRIEEYRVDGVIFHVLKGCHLNSMDAAKTSVYLKKNDIPMLKIESEYDEGDREQLRIRIEAFLEMIQTRKEDLPF
jgi:benzoyl-CoA reductase/2-hydroxyglutaryl-CoA dehydratase subunit BcrC/BadD/HgdB